jgi:cytochrome o ubiquinol oxidase subunit 2
MKKAKPVLFMLVFSGIVLFLILLLQPLEIIKFKDYIAVLFPKGIIGVEQRNLLLIIQAIMLLVVIPVYILTFIFSWKYRAYAPKEDYDPDIVDSVVLEYIWWGLPLLLTAVIAVLTWIKTHELDPYKPIASDKKPKTIQVVALQYKWLFLYPEEKIASLNFLQIPVNTPIKFEVSADAPMNSFWVPELGGQIYAMPGMRTELNLIANETGDFRGSSANISGEGFARMHFVTRSSTKEDYDKWVAEASKSSKNLDFKEYEGLVPPSENPPELYKLADENLFDQIIHKFMHPQEKT